MFADVMTAPVSERLRAALCLVQALTLRPDEVSMTDIEACRAAGLTDAEIRDAAVVCSMFSIITRLADSLEFAVPEKFPGGESPLVTRGYKLPPPVLLLPRG